MFRRRNSRPVEAADGVADARELGQTLREMRVALNREIEDVAAELRIRLVYLKAIEDGNLDDLPGPAYTTGFLRAYADYLGLDSEEVIERFKQAGAVADRRTSLVLPSPVEEGRLPTASIFLVALVLASAVYGGWYYLSAQGKDPARMVAEIPNEVRALIGVAPGQPVVDAEDAVKSAVAEPAPMPPAANATSGQTPPPADRNNTAAAPVAAAPVVAATEVTPPDTPVARDPAATVETASSKVPAVPAAAATETESGTSAAEIEMPPVPPAAPEAATERVAAAPADADEESETPPAPTAVDGSDTVITSTGAEESASVSRDMRTVERAVTESLRRIVLRATADTWVEVRTGDDSTLFSQLMRKGDTYIVPDQPGLKMMTGNAGGIDIVVDGNVLPPLGPTGGIRKGVALDASSLLDLTARGR